MKRQKKLKDKLYESHPYGIESVSEKFSLFSKYHNKNVLVAGCGAGDLLFDLLLYGANVTGIDQSSESINFLKN